MARRTEIAFAALLDCCRWPHDPVKPAWLSPDFPWGPFERLVRRHRVAGLAWRRLQPWAQELPPEVQERLGGEARRLASAGLLQASRALELAAALRAARIRHLFIKGTSLERLAYGQIGLKHASDLDVLVDEDALARTGDLLRARGFEPVADGAGPATVDADDPHKHDSWLHAPTGIYVELHARLVDNPRLLQDVGVGSARQFVALAGSAGLHTLEDGPLFAYLCVHGASHGWSRLKWLADLIAWLRNKPDEEVRSMFEFAQRVGAGRAAGQALLLGERLLGLSLDPGLRDDLRARPAHAALARLAILSIKGPRPFDELEDRLGGRVALHLSHFILAPGASHGRAEWTRKARALGHRLRARVG